MACQLVVHEHFVAIYDVSDSQKPAKTSLGIPRAFVRVWWAFMVVGVPELTGAPRANLDCAQVPMYRQW